MKHRFIITDKDGQQDELLIPKWRQTSIFAGQQVSLGEVIVDGTPNPHDILHTSGINELVKYFVNEMQKIYITHGVRINDKHFEVIIRQMLRTVIIIKPGDTSFINNEIVLLPQLIAENQRIAEQAGKQAIFKPNLLGITKASLTTTSFLSAASFMNTTRVLLTSATNGKIDELRGIKENAIIGRLIPAGTGLAYHKKE